MAVTANLYGNFFKTIFNKETDLDTDVLKGMLCTSSYTPDKDAHDYKNDITNEITGTGYVAGGTTLTSVAVSYTAANSWGVSRANSTAYAQGAIVRPASGNGYIYLASTGGTSAGSIPTYPTNIGGTVTDGSVVWTCIGRGIIKMSAADLAWASSTLVARYLVLYNSSPGSDATRPLIGYVDFGGDVSTTNGTFSVPWDAQQGVFVIPVA